MKDINEVVIICPACSKQRKVKVKPGEGIPIRPTTDYVDIRYADFTIAIYRKCAKCSRKRRFVRRRILRPLARFWRKRVI